MGGRGSGRRWRFDACDTVEDLRSIDIRRWKRAGRLSPGQAFSWQWSRDGEVIASIAGRAEPGQVVLSYRVRDRGEADWRGMDYPVSIATTPCHLGGERPWFLCPARGCGRRVAILYGGAVFAGRRCHRLAYPSQREPPYDRAARRADRIRDRLGWEPGILEGSDWGKPRDMHWRTYHRLRDEHDALARRAIAGITERFGPPL